MTTSEFIEAHREDDCAALALRYSRVEGVNVPFALQQIAALQTAKRKLPTWNRTEGIVFPARLAMEQCSSEQTATYKRRLAERLIKELSAADEAAEQYQQQLALTDLTGGFGVDFALMASLFHNTTYVERSPELCHVVQNNLPLLGIDNATVVCEDAVEHLKRMSSVTLLYIDPARRDTNGRRAYAISDCTPDILALLPQLMQKCKLLLLKLSPMLDITQTVSDIERGGLATVTETHVVATGNECKELLMVVRSRKKRDDNEPLRLFCCNDNDVFSVDDLKSSRSSKPLKSLTNLSSSFLNDIVGSHLYEPNAAIMKAGCFGELGLRFGIKEIYGNSHLFLSRRKIDGFPGRKFLINAATTMQKDSIKSVFANMKSANVAVRNFPLTAEQLRKRLRLKDGGDTFVFGTTVQKVHLLLICSKC